MSNYIFLLIQTIKKLNKSNVTNMKSIFSNCSNFNQSLTD